MYLKDYPKKYHTVGTVQKYDRQIVERGKMDTPSTQINDRFPGMVKTLQQ
jgi:hypothetical protein